MLESKKESSNIKQIKRRFHSFYSLKIVNKKSLFFFVKVSFLFFIHFFINLTLLKKTQILAFFSNNKLYKGIDPMMAKSLGLICGFFALECILILKESIYIFRPLSTLQPKF